MYAIVDTGSKQSVVRTGDKVIFERFKEKPDSATEIEIDALAVISDDKKIVAEGKIKARVIGLRAGKKIKALTYKAKANQRRRYGHRQTYHEVEILAISTK